jgi:uncharacterized protein with HEPN domain
MQVRLDQVASLVADQDRETFLADEAKPHALAMFFVVVGEAAGKVSPELKAAYPDLAWEFTKRLRNLIAHEYRRVDWNLLWTIATEDAPRLRADLPEPPPPDALD